jgi:signal recognition particle GTPase
LTAKENEFDVVLIDTAGRMQDNEVRELSRAPEKQ